MKVKMKKMMTRMKKTKKTLWMRMKTICRMKKRAKLKTKREAEKARNEL